MSQNQNCGCGNGKLNVPLKGCLTLDVDCGNVVGGDCCVDYSLEEQWTGRHWIDGKKIYQKTTTYEGSLPADETVSIPMQVSNLEAVVKMDTMVYSPAPSPAFSEIPYVGIGVGNDSHISFDLNTNCFKILSHKSTRTPVQIHITALYTCADR